MTLEQIILSGTIGTLTLVSLPSFAAETSDLAIGGTIRPVACDVTLSNGGVIDYGTVSATLLKDSAATLLEDKNFDLNVACGDAARIVIHARDNNSSKRQNDARALLGASGSRASGIGSGNTSSGAYVMIPTDTTADGAAAAAVETSDKGKTWGALSKTTPVITWPTSDDYLSWGNVGSTMPSAFTNMTQGFKLRTALAPKSKLPDLANELPFDGSVTFEIVYP